MSTREIVHDLTTTSAGYDPAATERLRARLAADAERAGMLDVAYRTVDSPLGRLLLAAHRGRARAGGLRARGSRRACSTSWPRLISPRVLAAPARLDPVAARARRVLRRVSRTSFDVPVDLRLAHGFRRTVLEHLRSIAYGATESYAVVAAGSGNPTAVRAGGVGVLPQSGAARGPVPPGDPQ